jgi:hypothetical protein
MQQIGQFVPGFSHQACKDRDDWLHKQARKDLGQILLVWGQCSLKRHRVDFYVDV